VTKTNEVTLSRGKRFLAGLIGTLMVLVIVFVVGELMVRFIKPQPMMYPRWQFSTQYGAVLFPDRTMVHEQPGRWRFEYTTNANRCRGELIPMSNDYVRANVVILGDSYSFGTGVSDTEVYAAVLSDELGDGYDTINLAVGGWGLTQHIRRFYEFGRLYDPSLVVLQFCNNDPTDNFRNRVTTIEDGRFVFHDSAFGANSLKRFLSDSVIQKSQLYNLIRNPLYRRVALPKVGEAMERAEGDAEREVPVGEQFHNDLLDLFTRDLQERGVALVLIAVDGQLRSFPHIHEKVLELESRGLLRYCEVQEWFGPEPPPPSPEGHIWGSGAHAIIGRELADVVRELDAAESESQAP